MPAAFAYDAGLLERCAGNGEGYGDAACRELYRQYRRHHHRRLSDREGDELDGEDNRRYLRFVESAAFVRDHNADAAAGEDGGHRRHLVVLNRFSDRFDDELPLLRDRVGSEGGDHPPGPGGNEDENDNGSDFAPSLPGGQGGLFLMWSGADRPYLYLGGKEFWRGGKGWGDLEKETEKEEEEKEEKEDGRGGPVAVWTIEGPGRPALGPWGGEDSVEEGKGEDPFGSYLNWATERNPDGVPIVHPAMDQGECGSCWAVAATGTVEATAARSAAFRAFRRAEASGLSPSSSLGVGRKAEADALLSADLSVQELIDCDVHGRDQGCRGGNPLLASPYLRRHGLTSTSSYPYEGAQGTCRRRRGDVGSGGEALPPVATAPSWGMLAPDHERAMELALRIAGPIAAGVDGSDPAFLQYGGGIYRPLPSGAAACGQDANHALLLTGYGETGGTRGGGGGGGGAPPPTRYWIARNSWGEDWGEGGYVRILRGSGREGEAGVCGIARTPSIALEAGLVAGGGRGTDGWWEGRGGWWPGTGTRSDAAPASKSLLVALIVLAALCVPWRRRGREGDGDGDGDGDGESAPLLQPPGDGTDRPYGSSS